MGRSSPYRWVVLGVSTGVNALAWGVRSTFALFFVALLDEFAWERGATALGYSLSWLCFVFFAPVAGWLSDRWGARTIVAAGGVILGTALALTAQATSLALYYVWFGVLGAAGTACMLIPSTTIVTRWFVQARGTAMGILSTGGPASGVVFFPVNAWLIATFGWRTALVVFGSIIALVTVSLALLYRERAREAPQASADAEPERAGNDWSLRVALRNGRLWAAFTMTALGVIGFQIMATHQVAHAVDRGFQYELVVGLFSFGAASMMAGNLLGGWLSDHFGRGWVFVLGTLVAMAGIACLAFVRGPQDVPLLLIYIASGFGFGMRIAQLSAIPADVFAGPRLGAILGVVHGGGGLGGAIGPFLGGWLFDVTGSYRLAFAAACAAIAGSAVAAWFAAPRRSGYARSRHHEEDAVPDYIPSPRQWVRDQVELYEGSGGKDGTTLRDTGLPVVIVTHTGNKTGAVRKTPLMRVKDGASYVLVGSVGGAPSHPVWVYNLRANPSIELRDKTTVQPMRVREVTDDKERARLWKLAVAAYPPYEEYQAKTTRRISVFVAEPTSR